MKNCILSLFTFIFCITAVAQTYPYKENFEGLVTGQPAPGWPGDINVRLAHGTNDSKALTSDMRSSNLIDSVTSPLIGPLTGLTNFTFFYRAVDFANWPSTPTLFDGGDKLIVSMSTDSGANFHEVYRIDSTNHIPSFQLRKMRVFTTQYAGANAIFKFTCTFGNGERYYLDIDSIVVEDGFTSAIDEANAGNGFVLYPNPVNAGHNVSLQLNSNELNNVTVSDATGRIVFVTQTIANCQLPTANLSKGIYFVTIRRNEAILTQKLVIE